MHKRTFLKLGIGSLGLVGISQLLGIKLPGQALANSSFEITKSESEWRKLLSPGQYYVLRMQGTELPNSSPLNQEHRPGTFVCAGCQLPLFSSSSKYDSGTGWPSFSKPLTGAIATSEDHSFFMVRTEVHCRRCGGHLGHVFLDNRSASGERYCMNGLALKFLAS